MGLLEQEIRELRRLNKQMLNGDIPLEQVNTSLKIYAQTEKRAKLMLAGMIGGGRIMKKMDAANLVTVGAHIDTSVDLELEAVSCPDQNKIITLGDCLDYSGEHSEECGNCDLFGVARRKLLPEST